jgi:hypothetical protein
MARSGSEVDSTVEKPRPFNCVIRSVRDRANKWCVASPPVGAVIARDRVSTGEGRKIALFFTGRQHAGENLAEVLKRRAAELPAPIQMSDALSRNTPKPIKLLVAHCLAHGRRQFVRIAPNFPEPCRHVLEALGEVYHYDQLARQGELSRIERLHFSGSAAASRFRDGWCCVPVAFRG